MAKLGQINTGVQSFDDMLRQKVAEDIKTGQEIKENKTHTSSSGNTHGGGGKSVPSGGGGNSKGASNQAKTTAGRSRDSSPAPKPASTNPRATKKEAEADVKAVITDFLQKKSNPGQSAATMGRPSASAYRTEALKTSYKDSLSKGVTTPAKTDEEKNARGRVIFDALSPRSAERAKAGQLGASKQKNYFSDVSEYGVKKANDMAEKRTRNITNAISNSKDKVNVTEQQHIRRLANEDGEEWENYKAIQKQKEAGQNERATYLIDTYHLRGDTKKVAEYNRIYNTEGIDKANEYALMNSGYIDLSRYTGEDREAALKADIGRYYADGQSGILGDENFMWEFEKQNMNELDRRYYEKRDSVFNNYAQMMAKDPEAEKKISEGMGYINKQIDEAAYENAHARETGNYMAVDNDIMYSAMNDEQKRLWAYVSSISKDDEKKYLDSIAYRLDKQYNQNIADSIKNLPTPVAITADLLSSAFAQIPATSASFVNISNQAARELKGAEYMPSDALAQRNFGANMLGSLNSEALGRIDNDIIRELYSMGSSLVQNVAGMAVYQEFYPYIMALSAAGGTAQNTLQRGNSKNKAVINGAAVGAIEYFMEKAGFERYMEAMLKPGASTSKFIGFSKAVLSNTGSEALEEGVGAFAQGMVDLAICGDLSELNITKNMYMEKYRLGENDALAAAMFDCFVKEPFMNALSGAFTGGIIGGASHTLGLAREGVSFVESNIGDAALVTALKANPSTNTRQIADKILGKLSDGKRVSALDYGNLKSAMQSENIRVDGKKAAKAMEQTSGTPEILYKKNGGGVAGTVAASRLSGIQYSFLDTLGKSRGINFVVADYLGKNTGDGYVMDAANGLTSSKDPNTIFLSANSERPILAVAKHELVHMLKGTKSGVEYIDSIGKTLKNADSEAFETAIENIIDRHAAYGEVISRKAAIEELAADSAWKSVGKYSEVARLAEENPKLLKKVYNMIVDLAGTVSGAYKDTENFAEGLMDKMTEQELRSAKEMMGRALGETPANVDDFKFSLKAPPESFADMTDSEIEELELQSRGKAYGSQRGKNGLSDAEVRRSKLEAQDDMDVDYLKRENTTLRIMFDRLSKSVRSVTEGKLKLDSKALVNTVSKIISENQSKVATKTIAPIVAQAYSYINEIATNAKLSEKDSNILGDRADRFLYKAAKRIVDGSQTYDRTLFNATKEMRDYIRKTKIRIPQNFDSKKINDFRRENFGRMTLVKEGGTPIDSLYGELSSLYPDYFDESIVMNESDQLMHIASVLEAVRPMPAELSAGEYEDAVKDVAVQLSAAFTDVILDTKSRVNIVAQIEAETRERFRDFYAKAVKKETDKYTEKRKKLEKLYREKNEAIKERAKERKERAETLDTLQSLLKRVRKLRTTDPDARNKLNAVLAEVANLYDGAKGKPRVMAEDTLVRMFGDDYKNVLEHMSEDEKLEYAMKELEGGKQFISIDAIKRYYYDAVASDPNHVENNFLRRKFEAAEMTGLNEISIENAKDIIEILTAVETEVKNANKILDSEIKATVASAAHETMNQLKRIKGNKGTGRISSFITGHLTPVSAIRKFVGYQKDNKLVKLAEEINKGERTKDAVVQKCMQLFDGFISQKESKSFLESLDDVIEIAGVKMTKGMRLSICMYARNKQSAEHIHGGGITIPDLKLLKKGDKAAAYAKGRTVQISQEMQLEIASSLTEQEKAFLDSIDGVMNYIASEINKVSLQLYGVETANVKNYFPILTDKSFIGKDINAFDQVGGVENAGFMKERRPGAYTPIVLDNVMAVTMSHINAAAKVIGLSIPMRNFKMVYNSVSYAPVFDFEGPVRDTSYGSVVNTLKKTWGTEATDYIENFIKDIEVGRKEDKDYAKFLDKRFSALARSALLMNLSVVMKQVAAYPISAAELGHIALIKGAFHRITEADKALYDSLTPVIWKRKQGYGMADFADYANGPSIEQKLPALLGWIQKSDVATAYKICKACEMYVNSNYNYEKNSKEWKNKLAETINRAIERTQQGSNVSQRAAVLRSPNSLVHALNMFKTQTYLQFDLIYDAVGEFNAYKKYVKDGSVTKEDMSRSARKVANVFSAYLMSEIVMSAATAIWRAFAYDKKEWQDENGETTAKSILKFVGKTTILDGFGMLMFGNEISDLLYSIFTGDKYYGIDVSPVVLISDFGESLYKVFDKVQNINDIKKDGNYYTWKDMLKPTADAVEDFATMLGVPAKPAKRLAGGIYRNAFELIEKTPLAKEAETFKLAIEKVFGTPGNYIAERKSAANENYNAITNFENAEAYKRYERGAHVINVLEKYIAQNPDERSDIEYLMDKCIEYFDENNLPSDVAAEAERLYTTLQKLGYGNIASKVIPYTQADAVISFKYGGENFKHMLTAKQYSDYARRVNNANIEAYKELMNDETYKSQDAYTQAKMLDTLRSEKVREVEINIFDETVGFSDEQRRAEEKSQFNKAKDFTGLPGKKYIKLEDFQFEVTEETYKKYDDYLKAYDSKVKELMNSGVALNSISGFEKVYFKDDNGQKVYIDRPYNDYNETFKSKIDNKIAEIAKGTIENPQTEEHAQITKEIVYSTGNLYVKDQDVMNNINKGDYSKKLWQRKTVDNLRNNIKEQQAAVQSAEQQVQTGRQRVVNIANQYIGVPYEWGGMSPEGFDCSGFVQYVYKQYGITLPRTTAQQPNVGTAVDKSELQPGDLVFFRGSQPHSNGIGHVGIYIGNDQFIHAPSTGDVVKISKLSSRKDYKTARRIIND